MGRRTIFTAENKQVAFKLCRDNDAKMTRKELCSLLEKSFSCSANSAKKFISFAVADKVIESKEVKAFKKVGKEKKFVMPTMESLFIMLVKHYVTVIETAEYPKDSNSAAKHLQKLCGFEDPSYHVWRANSEKKGKTQQEIAADLDSMILGLRQDSKGDKASNE